MKEEQNKSKNWAIKRKKKTKEEENINVCMKQIKKQGECIMCVSQ
jgi:hypothetical protein